MIICAVRHLPTEWNLAGILQGRRNPTIRPPDKAMMAMSLETRTSLEERGPFGTVVASPLTRARETASWYGFPDHEVEPLLTELDFGLYEGRPKAELLRDHGDSWSHNPGALTLGEPVRFLGQRVRAFVDTYRARGCQDILLFGHGAWIRAMLSIEKTGDICKMNQFEIAVNSLSVATFEEG